MRLSTRTRYGLRAMVNIARNGGDVVSSEVIADCESISKKYLDGILGKLRRAGLVESQRGQGGGYFLARHPREITVLDVIRTLEGGACFTKCVEEPDSCPKSEDCAARALWEMVSDRTAGLMGSVTIERLAAWKPGEGLLP